MLRMILRRLLGLLAAVASGGVVMSCPAYGMPNPNGDPDVEITNFSYTPVEDITRGTDVTFRVTANQAPQFPHEEDMSLLLQMTGDQPGDSWAKHIELSDDGHDPDAIAGDLVYTGEWEVGDDRPNGTVVIRVDNYEGKAYVLTIVEDEQE